MRGRARSGRVLHGAALLFAAVVAALLSPAFAAAAAPVATTGTATDVTATSATLHGTVDPQGADTQYSFSYVPQASDGNPQDYGGGSAPDPAGSVSGAAGSTPVSVTISNLDAGTIYHVKLTAQNASGNGSGSDVTFATLPRAPVMLTPLSAPGDISETTAYAFDPIGLYGVPAWYHWEYGTTTSYGRSAPSPEAELDPPTACSVPSLASVPDYNIGAVAPCWLVNQGLAVATMTGLTPGTTYHYRLVAHNLAGQTVSPDATFTTSGVAPPPEPSPDPAPTPSPHPAAKPPRLAILSDRATVSREGTTAILLTCESTAGRCRGKLALTVSHRHDKHRLQTITLARGSATVRAGAVARIPLTLDRTGLRLLMHARRRRLHVRASVGSTHHTLWLAVARPGP